MKPNSILSIQSHVAFGYVGNRAAVFPLQRLGYDVSAVNTVQFSNHTGYKEFTGDIFSPTHIQELIAGLQKRQPLSNFSAILSGYMGSKDLGEVIINTVKQAKAENPELLYCCDPVLGDVGRGIFVHTDVAHFIRDHAIAHADIITPNQFELGFLANDSFDDDEKLPDIVGLNDILEQCECLRQKGPKVILVTSLTQHDASPDTIEMLVYTQEGAWISHMRRLNMGLPPNGAGDAVTAIFMAKYLETRDPRVALQHVSGSIHAIFTATKAAGTRELQLIAAQDEIVSPSHEFEITYIEPKNQNA